MELEELKTQLSTFSKTVSDSVKGEMKKEVETLASKFKEVEEKYAKGEDVSELSKTLETIKSDFLEMKQALAQKGVESTEGATFQQQLKAALAERLGQVKGDEKHRQFIADIKAKKPVYIFVKAAVNMTRALVNPTTGSRIPVWDREVGVSKAPDNMPFVTDLVSLGTMTSDTISWVERVSRDGKATTLNEGSAYAKISTQYQEFSTKAQKIGVLAKLTKESLDDIDFLMSEIQNECIDGELGVNYELDQQVLSGDGTAPNLKGILNYAVSFAKPSGLPIISSASNYDVIRTVALQGALAKLRFNYILLNPIEVAKMELTKDANGQYVIPPFISQNGKLIGGMTVIENVGIAAGSFLAGDFSRSGLFVKRGLELSFATENEDDWTKDFISVKASVRAAHRIKGPDANAFVKGTFGTAITSLSA